MVLEYILYEANSKKNCNIRITEGRRARKNVFYRPKVKTGLKISTTIILKYSSSINDAFHRMLPEIF
jgi:hypothetical protein